MRLASDRWSSWDGQVGLELGSRRAYVREGGLVEVVRLGEGEPIVMVGGLAGGWSLLAPLALRLSREHEVILCGLRGDLRSVMSRSVASIDDMARDLGWVIRELGLESPTLLGVSFGAAIALELAAQAPACLDRLIVHGVEARFQQRLGSRIARHVLERYALPTDNAFVNQFFRLLFGKGVPPGAALDFVIERCWATDPLEIAHRLRLLEEFDLTGRLDRVQTPTLVIAGERDVVVPPERQKALADSLDQGEFTILPQAGHVGFVTHASAFARVVREFVNAPVTAFR